jgi:hypothetical protein
MIATGSNWGPQDASHPKPNDTRIVGMEEVKSISGYFASRMGGPIDWGVLRERRASGSSCEAEIKAMDEGTKAIQYLRYLLHELGFDDADKPTPLLNDNSGAIDWCKNGCRPSKKTRHLNIRELRVAEAKMEGEIEIKWVASKENAGNLFTKEHNDVSLYCKLRDLMIVPREHLIIDKTNDDGGC